MFSTSSPLPLSAAMLQAIFKAPEALGESLPLVKSFYTKQCHPSGLFRDRQGNPDLYYSVFGLSASISLGIELPWNVIGDAVLHGAKMGGLDLIHHCSLIRCLALARMASDSGLISETIEWESIAHPLLSQLEQYRADDGGYAPEENRATGTAYGGFLALGAYQDWQMMPPDCSQLVSSLSKLEREGGGWANESIVPLPSVQATAASVSILHYLESKAPAYTAQWLFSMAHPQGGFRASAATPMPDLLSTGVALFTLSLLGEDLKCMRESCLDYADTLWSNEGGFHGHWADDLLDVEYTFYGLLTLGLLSQMEP